MIPIYNDFGEKMVDGQGNTLFAKTVADDELSAYPEPHVLLNLDGNIVNLPVWKYIEMYCPIENRESRLTGFALNKSQIEEYKEMATQYVERGIIRLNIGKSRQMGGTTLISAVLWTIGITNPGSKVGIIADTLEKGKGILNKYKVFYYNTPEALMKTLKKCEKVNNSTELTFDLGKGRTTSFELVVQGENAGASKHFNMIHESEVALWDNIEESIATVDQTVSDADLKSIIVRETTARGRNYWEKLYSDSKHRRGKFRAIFVPWFWEDTYASKYDGHPLSDIEEKLMSNYGCSLEQCQFYKDKLYDMGGNLKRMYSEYPCNDIEMFMGSGVSAFDGEILANLQLGEPITRGRFRFGTSATSATSAIAITSIAWEKHHNGPVKVLQIVPPSHPLFLSADPASGGSDYWAGQIIDNAKFSQVAVYHEQAKYVQSDAACLQMLVLLAAMQCGCFDADGEFHEERFSISNAHMCRAGVTGERNITTALFDFAWRLGLRRIPLDEGKEGYRTGVNNRKPMIDLLDQMVRDTVGKCVRDDETRNEMLKFQYQPFGRTGAEKLMAPKGEHDDLVMSLAGACYMSSYFPTTIDKAKEVAKKSGWSPWGYHNKEETSKHAIEWR